MIPDKKQTRLNKTKTREKQDSDYEIFVRPLFLQFQPRYSAETVGSFIPVAGLKLQEPRPGTKRFLVWFTLGPMWTKIRTVWSRAVPGTVSCPHGLKLLHTGPGTKRFLFWSTLFPSCHRTVGIECSDFRAAPLSISMFQYQIFPHHLC